MKRFQRILACVDALAESQGALQQASSLARHSGAELTIVDVEQGLSAFHRSLLGEYAKTHERERQKKLSDLAGRVSTNGLVVSAHMLRGRPFVEIVRQVVRGNYDLLIKDAEGQGKLLAASVDMRLLRNCPCPVWLIKPQRADRPIEKVLAAVDPHPGDDQHRELNHGILELAASLALLESSKLHVVSVWDVPGEELLHARVPPDSFREYVNRTHEAAMNCLCHTLKRAHVHLPEERIHFRKGDASPAIIKTARSLDADILVMGTVARTGIAGLLMGNAAEMVLRQLQRSVLAIKPEGFVTPVGLS